MQPPKTTSNNASTTSSETKYVPVKNGSINGVPQGVGTAPPAPPAPVSTAPIGTPKPACKTPYQDATATQAVTPDYPEAAREQGLGQVEVNVVVSLSPSGSPTGASVENSSGNMSIDQAAKQAAMSSTYAPKIVNCEPVASQYIYKVTFDPNS